VAVVQVHYAYTTNNTYNDTKQTIHRTTQKLGKVRAVPRLCGFYPDICLTTEEKAWKNLNQGSRRVPVGTMMTDGTIIDISESRAQLHIGTLNPSCQCMKSYF